MGQIEATPILIALLCIVLSVMFLAGETREEKAKLKNKSNPHHR